MKKNKILSTISLLSLVFAGASCETTPSKDSETVESSVSEAKEVSFELDHNEVSMGVGSIIVIKATKDATFTTTDDSIISMTVKSQANYVLVKALKDGVATVKAKDNNGTELTCTINVVKNQIDLINVNNDEISIDLTSPQFEILHTVSYTMEQDVTYESSNNKILTVGANGMINAIRPGNATVTLKHSSGAEKILNVTVTGTYIPPEVPNSWSVGPIAAKSHVQGIAIDDEHQYVYYTFTNIIVKTDTKGNVLGSIDGFPGHVGDCKFNDDDGYLYALFLALPSWGWDYERQGAYILQIDVSKIDRMNMDYKKADYINACWIQELEDLKAIDTNGDGTADGKYGVDAVDGLGIGPKFGSTDGKKYITISTNNASTSDKSLLSRTDNDQSVIFQFDIDEFNKIKQPIDYESPKYNAIYSEQSYFLYTGDALEYGPQVIEYDPYSQRWFFVTYGRGKTKMLPASAYTFVVKAEDAPVEKEVSGCPGETGLHLVLSKEGTKVNDDVYCYSFWQANTGLISLGNGKFLVSNSKNSGGQCTDIDTWEFSGEGSVGFEKVY